MTEPEARTCTCCGPAVSTGPPTDQLAAAQDRVTDLIAQTAATQTALAPAVGMPAPVAELHHATVDALAEVARLQTAASIPVIMPLSATDPTIACTLDGGLDAMRGRISEWQYVVGRATRRVPVPSGVTLHHDHDAALTVELARLAAAEFACCSFFEFTLSVGPTGMSFTVTAPVEAKDVIVAMFGAYGPVGAS